VRVGLAAKGAGRPVGPESQDSMEPSKRGWRRWQLLLLLADNYGQAATANHKGTKAQRTPKEIRGGPPALRSLRARGPAAPGSPSTVDRENE